MKKNFKQKIIISTFSLAMAFTAFGSIASVDRAENSLTNQPTPAYATTNYRQEYDERQNLPTYSSP